MQAIHLAGRIDEDRKLVLEEEIPITGPRKVDILILLPDDDDESGWLKAGARNPTFGFLHDSREDIYTTQDGKPFDAKG